MTLEGKVALVTGGSRGIGRAICEMLAASGAKVIVNYVSQPASADEVVAAITAKGGEATAVQFNVSSAEEVQAACKTIIADHGQIDILVNNAGITRDGLLAMMKEDNWDLVQDINLKGAFNCIKAVSRSMMKKRWGRVINITSVVGFTGNAGQVNYAAAKAGMIGLTKSVARELASRGITVNAVAPGYIDTDMTSGLDETVKQKIFSEIPLGHFGSGADVAAAVGFLASEQAGYITGNCIHVNGGMFMA